MTQPFDIFSRIPPHLAEMFKYKTSIPPIVFGQTMLSQQITIPSGGAAVKIVTAERPKVYMLTNIHDTEVYFIGSEGVTLLSGFPINKFERMLFGLMENTTLWGCATNQCTAYLIDLGL